MAELVQIESKQVPVPDEVNSNGEEEDGRDGLGDAAATPLALMKTKKLKKPLL